MCAFACAFVAPFLFKLHTLGYAFQKFLSPSLHHRAHASCPASISRQSALAEGTKGRAPQPLIEAVCVTAEVAAGRLRGRARNAPAAATGRGRGRTRGRRRQEDKVGLGLHASQRPKEGGNSREEGRAVARVGVAENRRIVHHPGKRSTSFATHRSTRVVVSRKSA